MEAKNNLTATTSVLINKPVSVVWKALIDPEKIKEYLFGTQTETDWKPGSPITFRGEWQGQTYEDKGKILEVKKEKLLSYTYWSSMSGKPDMPENYATVTFTLIPGDEVTKVTITQDNNFSEESRLHSENNWNTVLKTMKEKVELS
jgi:uncharacterized protein YndB with AHSA1/START domain